MFTDSTGYWVGFDDVFTGPVDEIIVLGLLAIAALVGISGAADALDDFVNVIGNTLSNVADEIKKATKTISVAIVITIASIKGRNVGAYVIQFSDGSYYVGKGSPARIYISAMREGVLHGTLPMSVRYESCSNDREAYKREYMLMVDYGYYSGTIYMYNRIWFSGRTYYLMDYGTLYSDDYLGR
ncbi:hypothetical protein RJI07_08620 [Mycoplasmatota bacterium WC30]